MSLSEEVNESLDKDSIDEKVSQVKKKHVSAKIITDGETEFDLEFKIPKIFMSFVGVDPALPNTRINFVIDNIDKLIEKELGKFMS